MKFSLSWLRDHLDTTASLDEITTALVAIGIEVEGVDDPRAQLAGLVVGHVATCERHPNADRLNVCTVHDGTTAPDGTPTTYQVVCGAPNARAGMNVAFARVGVVIPETQQSLKKGSIRGIESQGMLCSSRELLLGNDHDGIMDLNINLPLGQDLATALGHTDPVIDISLTPNRSDCFSIYGIARDLAAFGLGTLKPRPIPSCVSTAHTCPITVSVTDPHTSHFAIRVIKGVVNGESPSWVQDRLRSAGCRPISALVDVTNYICLTYGRPLHVFDAQKLRGDTLLVHAAQGGESFIGLNDKEYTLSPGMTVISDATGIISLAGVMGGASTGCDETTTDVAIESAVFDPARIALTGQSTALLSDARTRFERGVDPSDVMFGLDLATHYIMEWCHGGAPTQAFCAGTAAGSSHDHFNPPILNTVTLTQDRLTAISGDATLTLNDTQSMLNRLGIHAASIDINATTYTIPSYRHDITLDVDIIEEILRLRGYDAIPEVSLPLCLPQDTDRTRERLTTLFTSRGYNEVYTWSFIPHDIAVLFGDGIPLAKPLNADMSTLRPSVLPGLLAIAENGQKRSQPNSAFIEYAPQFKTITQTDQAAPTLTETRTLSAVRVFAKGRRHWQKSETPADFFSMKHDVITALELSGIANVQCERGAPTYYHPGRSMVVKQGRTILAYVGELHPNILKKMNISGVAFGFEIYVDALPKKPKDKRAAFIPAVYQSVSRDFAFWVKTDVTADQVIKVIQKIDRELIDAIHIFDVYCGDKAPRGEKSIACEVVLQPKKQTLTDDDLMTFQNKVIADIAKHCGGRIRDSA